MAMKDNPRAARGKRKNMRILDDPKGFFKDMRDKEFVEWLDEIGINYKLKDGVKIV